MGYQNFKELRVWQRAKKILVACAERFTNLSNLSKGDSPIHPFTHSPNKGVTLVELMITLVIFSIVISMIYSVFNAFVKQATSERKVAKTEMDVINVVWPLIKEIQTAGFGVPKYDCSATTQCACGLVVADRDSDGVNDLIIHGTAAADDQYAGKWGYVGTSCVLSTSDIPSGQNVVVISNTDKSRLARTTVNASNALSSCGSNETNVAYWTPYAAAGDLECYETIYSLQPYASGTRPATCESNTRKLTRSTQTDNTPYFATMLDCVFGSDGTDTGFNYRFGCISSSGNLTWQAGTDCGTSKLRLVKIGVVVQNSTRRDIQSPATITLFEGLRTSTGTSLEVSIDLTTDQRYYKWRKLEQTITLKNLE